MRLGDVPNVMEGKEEKSERYRRTERIHKKRKKENKMGSQVNGKNSRKSRTNNRQYILKKVSADTSKRKKIKARNTPDLIH